LSDEKNSRFLIKNLPIYWVDTGLETNMDNLRLVCDDFSLSFSFRFEQRIPFSFLPFNELDQEVKNKLERSPYQSCRFFGYSDNKLTGVSMLFQLIFPLKKANERG